MIEAGVQIHATWDNMWTNGQPTPQLLTQLDTLADHGIKHARVDFGWSTAQPTNAPFNPNQYYIQRLVRTANELQARGMTLLVTVHQSPEWARPGTGTNVKQYPSNYSALQSFMTSLVTLLGDRVEAWEVWNEPNLTEFTGVSGDEQAKSWAYSWVLSAAAAGIRAADPDVGIVFGGPAQTDNKFIDEMLWRYVQGDPANRNTALPVDIMSWHPYQADQTRDPFSTDLWSKGRMTMSPAVFESLAYWQKAQMPIWLTEVGFSVHANAPGIDPWKKGVPTDEDAVDSIHRTFEYFERMHPTVERVYWYTTYRESSDVHLSGFSLLKTDGSPKPQLLEIAHHTGQS